MEDANHIRALSICHYVLAGVTALGASFPLIHVAMGIFFISGAFPGGGSSTMPAADASMIGWMFVAIGGVLVLVGWAFAICMFLTGRWLAARRNRTFCFVVACAECLFMPLGTVLGIFTILVLQRPGVGELFVPPPLRTR